MLNIKKQFVVSLLAISFVILPALAAERPETGSRSEIPDIKGTLKKERLGKDKIKIFGDKAFRRLTEALNRAEGFSERVAFHANQFPNPKFNITLVEQKLNEAKEIILEDPLHTHIKSIQLFGSAVENKLTFKSDMDIAVKFDSISLKDATLFRKRVLGKSTEKIDVKKTTGTPAAVPIEDNDDDWSAVPAFLRRSKLK